MPSVTMIPNPHSPGAQQEAERLRRENAELRKRLGLAPDAKIAGAELTPQEEAEQARKFTVGLCTVEIKPLTSPLVMNPAFAAARPHIGAAKAKAAPRKLEIVEEKPQTVAVATDENDEAVLRFQMIELDR